MPRDLDDDYARAGFGRRLGFGAHPVVLVVDLVKAYLDPASPLYAAVENVVTNVARVVEAARAAGVPVVFTRVAYGPGSADGGLFVRKLPALRAFERGGAAGEIVDEVAPHRSELVVEKQYASAFFGTSLAPTLTSLGADTVVVTGLTTSGCVRATAVDATQHGFVPVVVRQAVGDRDVRPHEANLFDLQAKYADVVDVDDVLGHLAGHAGRPS